MTKPFIFFTFQSGSIQMNTTNLYSISSTSFTFQSGSIQIKTTHHERVYTGTFTFQSGSIQITTDTEMNNNVSTLHSNLVLFKCCLSNVSISDKILYIPIWFYSNFIHSIESISWIHLYIPIWFYSNVIGSVAVVSSIYTLHSNLVLFKC